MADGPFRFHQGAGQFYYPQQGQQTLAPRPVHQRTESPANLARLGLGTDTPSPSRSTGRISPSHNPLVMYNQGHQQGQNVFLNGAQGHSRFGMQLNAGKGFPNAAQGHPGHSQHRQQQDHAGHGQNSNFANHQQNATAAAFNGSTPQFGANQMRNGTPNSMQNGVGRPINEQWAQQLSLAQHAREATGSHPHARNHPAVTKGSSSVTETRKDTDREERNRATNKNESDNQEWHELDMGGQGLRALSTPLFYYTFLTKLYLNQNKLSLVPPTIGRLRSLTVLDLSLNELTDLPPEVGMLVNLRSLLLFDNQIEALPYELGSLYQLDMLGIEGNPLAEDIKGLVMEEGTKSLITHLREQAEVPEPPRERDWIILDDGSRQNVSEADKFTVFSYNTLCDKYVTQSQYGYAPQNALTWENRKEVILSEVRSHNADILCMQETETDAYQEFFRPALAHNDYKGVFWPKTRARTMTDKEAKLVDGCSIFYKDTKYILLEKQYVDFANIAINRPDMRGEQDIFNRVMPRDHIAVVAFLENRQTGTRLMVVNAHLEWNSVYKDVKLVQIAILLEQIAKIADVWAKRAPLTDKEKVRYRFSDVDGDGDASPTPVLESVPSVEYASGPQIPMVLCGDFNSLPDSAVHELITHGSLPKSHADLGDYKYGNFTRDGMAHPFNLKSAYGGIGELRFTNYTPGFQGVIDYIWYTTNAMQVTGLLGEVDHEYLQRVPGFPNYHFPSDHLALLAQFVMKPAKAARKAAVEADFGLQRK